jgi:hypothetical protein
MDSGQCGFWQGTWHISSNAKPQVKKPDFGCFYRAQKKCQIQPERYAKLGTDFSVNGLTKYKASNIIGYIKMNIRRSFYDKVCKN